MDNMQTVNTNSHICTNILQVIRPDIVMTNSITYSGCRLLTVVCPNDLSSPSKSPAKLIGSTTPNETAVIIAIKTIMCLWNDKY